VTSSSYDWEKELRWSGKTDVQTFLLFLTALDQPSKEKSWTSRTPWRWELDVIHTDGTRERILGDECQNGGLPTAEGGGLQEWYEQNRYRAEVISKKIVERQDLHQIKPTPTSWLRLSLAKEWKLDAASGFQLAPIQWIRWKARRTWVYGDWSFEAAWVWQASNWLGVELLSTPNHHELELEWKGSIHRPDWKQRIIHRFKDLIHCIHKPSIHAR